jgi:hypothetical protein
MLMVSSEPAFTRNELLEASMQRLGARWQALSDLLLTAAWSRRVRRLPRVNSILSMLQLHARQCNCITGSTAASDLEDWAIDSQSYMHVICEFQKSLFLLLPSHGMFVVNTH